jgi:hypothetical protein
MLVLPLLIVNKLLLLYVSKHYKHPHMEGHSSTTLLQIVPQTFLEKKIQD